MQASYSVIQLEMSQDWEAQDDNQSNTKGSLGRRIVGWDPILWAEHLISTSTVQRVWGADARSLWHIYYRGTQHL